MRSKKLMRDRIHGSQQRKNITESEEFMDEEDMGSDYENEEDEEEQEPKRKAATKRPLFVLLGDEDEDEDDEEDGEKEQDIEDDELSSKDECIRQINSAQYQTARKPKEARFIWSPKATNILIDLWMANRIELAVSGKKKTPIYKRFADKLKFFGPNYAEVKSKMDNMSRKYRLEAEKLRKSGQRSKWEYFQQVQSCLIGTNSVDVFNEIMFDTPAEPEQLIVSAVETESVDETSVFVKSEASTEEMESQEYIKEDIEKPILSSQEDNYIANELDETEPTSYSPPIKPRRRKIAHRLFKIEEEKLALEREQLKIMKETSEQMKFFYRDLLRMLKQN